MPVGRRRSKNLHLPPLMTLKRGRYYFGRNQEFLGTVFTEAILAYGERVAAMAGHRPRLLKDLADNYFKSKAYKGLAPRTKTDYADSWKRLAPVIGNAPLETIRPMHLAQYLERRPAKTQGNREVALVSTMWNWGRSQGDTDLPNPCLGVKRNKETPRDKLVSPAELAKERAVASQALADALDLYDLLGARVSELLRMNLPSSEARELTWKQQKTGKMMRVEIEGELAAKLAEIRAREFPAGVVVSMALLRNEKGERMTYSALEQRHARARAQAGVDFQLRDLRGKAATESADAVGLRETQKLLGHASITMTERYVKARGGEVLRTRKRIADKGGS
jgi:integrase